jgi:hypothetical protein
MTDDRSGKLPTDPFDMLISKWIGLPNGAHTAPTVVQDVDFYGKTTSYMLQTVRDEKGPMVFVTQVNAEGATRYILPPAVLRAIDRQRDAATTQIRRRHGKRLAAARGPVVFTDDMRERARVARRANAAKRAKRRKRTAARAETIEN